MLVPDQRTLLGLAIELTRRVLHLQITGFFRNFNFQKPYENISHQGKDSGSKSSPPEQGLKTTSRFQALLERDDEFKYELVNYLLPFCRKVLGTLMTIFRFTSE